MAEKDFFVGIYDPQDVRRNVLESSKEVVNSLQSHDSLKSIRRNKLKCYKGPGIFTSDIFDGNDSKWLEIIKIWPILSRNDGFLTVSHYKSSKFDR